MSGVHMYVGWVCDGSRLWRRAGASGSRHVEICYLMDMFLLHKIKKSRYPPSQHRQRMRSWAVA